MTTRAEHITRVMAGMGFLPTREIDTRYVEYYKDYAEPHGRVARCVILFNKGGVIANLDHAQLEGFVVTVQGQVPPIAEDITTRAPKIMHDDMMHALQELQGIGGPPPQAVETVLCNNCGHTTDEFVVNKSGHPVCPDCLITAVG